MLLKKQKLTLQFLHQKKMQSKQSPKFRNIKNLRAHPKPTPMIRSQYSATSTSTTNRRKITPERQQMQPKANHETKSSEEEIDDGHRNKSKELETKPMSNEVNCTPWEE
ncbi:hypothetical protein M758_8G074500 [Ceratodon purpureus]|uniref:Uncharacterized protein n=1 Tax=Ceratodon purpureus TaxID=3225 RepID=A0A8T0GWK0_CERPU|nr:hypothetical protein KC19_8G079700 [Ceratodon purpureus]KAG0608054.1 hypothetical protein M758_8G074500 [Ceratodon purpureus]